jgi:hypothetical protein
VAQDAAQEERQRHLRHAELADIKDSSIAPAIIESCASRIFLPNPQATEPQIRTIYEGFGLNSRQIEIVATAARSATTTTNPASATACSTSTWGRPRWPLRALPRRRTSATWTRCCWTSGVPGFAAAWLRHRGLIGPPTCCPRSPALRR